MFFDFVNVPVIFQMYINEMLQHLIDIIYIIYLNNILIYFTIKKQYVKNICAVFLQLQKYCLYINLKKYSFFVLKIEFLDFIVRTAEIKMNLFWVKLMMIWLWFTFYKDVQIFLSFTNFYHQFINHYFKITASLTELLKGSVKSKKIKLFEFLLIIKEVFNELWKAFCSVSVLKHFNSVLSIWLETDASDFTLVNILSQLFRNINKNGINWHSITFWLQKMIDVKICYKIYNDELLIIIIFFKHWCYYLNSNQYSIEVFINHNKLWYFINKARLNDHQNQWFMMFVFYDFVIAYWFDAHNSINGPSH